MELKLKGSEILEKEFKTGLRGYNQEEVDTFLMILFKIMKHLKRKLRNLNMKINNLKKS